MNKEQLQQPTILCIIGITGDLARRKLVPSIVALQQQGLLPEKFHLIGITRQKVVHGLFADIAGFEKIAFTLFSMDLEAESDYTRLLAVMDDIAKGFGSLAQRLVYLSVPPEISHGIITLLGTSTIAAVPDTKLLLEKPFGTDLESARALIAHISAYFMPEQVYRIDHYLAKDMVQDIIRHPVVRDTAIAEIRIIASESIGIEGRAAFYEQTGALRDLVQSHLLQLAAMTMLGEGASLHERRRAALRQLQVTDAHIVRGQYQGYKDEVGNTASMVETFVSMTLRSNDQRYRDVPIRISTGKQLDRKYTSVKIMYTNAQEVLFTDQSISATSAYERVFHDAMHDDKELFVSDDEVLECWRIIAPIQKVWQAGSSDLRIYPAGSSIQDIV